MCKLGNSAFIDNSNIGIIIQARIGSTRLPGKILRPFYKDKTILDIIIETLEQFGIKLILAFPFGSENNILAEKYGLKIIFRGSEENVLERIIKAAEFNNVDTIIRVCADNPFLDFGLLHDLLIKMDDETDYLSYKINNIPAIKTHFGFFSEVVCLKTLKDIASRTQEKLYREHVTNYIYSHERLYKIKWITAPDKILKNNSIRLTIDTIDDFITAKEIYYQIFPEINYDTVIDYINTKPDLFVKMRISMTKNLK